VHALRHVHSLLVPGGTVVDLHPLDEERLEAAGRPLGVIEETEWVTVDLPNSEVRLRDVIRGGLYALETEVEFELLQHFDDAGVLLEAKADLLEQQAALVREIRAATPPFVTREEFVLRRLRAC
jgi:hypothetical protein